MLNPKMQEALNRQINAELFSSYLYLSMAAQLELENLAGMAHWMRVQAVEENQHAMKIFDYVLERGGQVKLAAIEAPKTAWKSPLEIFEESYAHEQKISGMINNLMDLSVAEKDHASHDFLEWFVREQVEEEAAVQLIVAQLKMAGESGGTRLMLVHQLGQRAGK